MFGKKHIRGSNNKILCWGVRMKKILIGLIGISMICLLFLTGCSEDDTLERECLADFADKYCEENECRVKHVKTLKYAFNTYGNGRMIYEQRIRFTESEMEYCRNLQNNIN